MAAPFMLVTFTDAEGDEFPIRVEGMWTKGQRQKLLEEAQHRLDQFIDAGDLRPTQPVKPTSVVLT